jgi:alkanesulfonate monooxygenase SsuD/methylene tetrahydromethanopterin reductase-like flavin-dependent oxidoreductase (luciferase family)
MKYGISIPNFGDDFGTDVRHLAGLAREAEDVGWDGFFLWDHVQFMPTPTVDPWIALTAIALATQRVRIGTLVTPLPRRRPVKVARETVTLDQLSDGRLVLGVGIGTGPWEWDYLGEETDLPTRGAMLDEGLDLLTKLWSGEPVLHSGQFYHYRGDFGPGNPAVNATPMLPKPRQTPRIPIWIAGTWPAKPPFRRAARWDGVVPLGPDRGLGPRMLPDDVRDMLEYMRPYRRDAQDNLDVAVAGETSGSDTLADRQKLQPYVTAGATWWIEDISPWAFGWTGHGSWPILAMTNRVRRGPPRLPTDA